nr:hypothetical protein Q903MT_gene2773 [Picea sitchensis]
MRSDPCLLNSGTPGYCWENPMILPCGREGRKKGSANTDTRMQSLVHGDRIGDRELDAERAFQAVDNPYLYIPWQRTDCRFVVVVNPRPIPVPNNLHEKTTMISW